MTTATLERTQAPERERILSNHIATAGHLLANELDPNAVITAAQIETAVLSQEILSTLAQRSVDERRKYSQDTNLTYDEWRRGLINWIADLPTNQEERRRKSAALQNMGIAISGFDETAADRFYTTYFGQEGLGSNVDLFISDIADHYANNLEGLESALIYLGPLAIIFGINSAEAVKELVYARCIERNAENRQIVLREYRGKPTQPPVPEHGQRVLNFIRIGQFVPSRDIQLPIQNQLQQPGNTSNNIPMITDKTSPTTPQTPSATTTINTPAAITVTELKLGTETQNTLRQQLQSIQSELQSTTDTTKGENLELLQYVIQQRLDGKPIRQLTDKEVAALARKIAEIKQQKKNLVGNDDLLLVKADMEILKNILQKVIDANPKQLTPTTTLPKPQELNPQAAIPENKEIRKHTVAITVKNGRVEIIKRSKNKGKDVEETLPASGTNIELAIAEYRIALSEKKNNSPITNGYEEFGIAELEGILEKLQEVKQELSKQINQLLNTSNEAKKELTTQEFDRQLDSVIRRTVGVFYVEYINGAKDQVAAIMTIRILTKNNQNRAIILERGGDLAWTSRWAFRKVVDDQGITLFDRDEFVLLHGLFSDKLEYPPSQKIEQKTPEPSFEMRGIEDKLIEEYHKQSKELARLIQMRAINTQLILQNNQLFKIDNNDLLLLNDLNPDNINNFGGNNDARKITEINTDLLDPITPNAETARNLISLSVKNTADYFRTIHYFNYLLTTTKDVGGLKTTVSEQRRILNAAKGQENRTEELKKRMVKLGMDELNAFEAEAVLDILEKLL